MGRVAGSPVHALSRQDAAARILDLALRGEPNYVCFANVHMMTLARRDRYLKQVLDNAALVASDGMPLVCCLRHQGFRGAQRVAGPDLTFILCDAAQEQEIPVFFFGSNPETARRLGETLRLRFPRLHVAGIESPPLLPARPLYEASTATRIARSGARLVFIGLGCPKQEFWMAAHSPYIPATLLGVGAAFDFLAGTTRRAPYWAQKLSLEWAHRLIQEPGRLWKRYFFTNIRFAGYLLTDTLRRSRLGRQR